MTTRPPDAERDRERPGERAERVRTDAAPGRLRRSGLAVLGSALLIRGLRRRSLRGVATALAGGWLLARAVGERTRLRRALDLRSVTGQDDAGEDDAEPASISRSITVGKPAAELFELWRDPEQLSEMVGDVADVESSDGERFRWTVHGPRERDVAVETRLVEVEPGELLRFAFTGNAPVEGEATVRFEPAPGDRGTRVTLSVAIGPPGGRIGREAVRRLDVVPEAIVGETLRRFKSLAESGEIQTHEGNTSGRGRGGLL